ncbi:MAG: tetratricopeptide repeat protein, partial [Microcystaceae cyanobacterium]
GQFIGGSGSLSPSQRRKLEQNQEVVALTDTDYEFLFNQLLEGISHGWHEGRVLKFFDQLQERGKAKPWVGWLERFGEKVLASPAPNLPLATRMMRLGELAQSFPKIEPIGHQAYLIGRQLYARETVEDDVWEYSGPDVELMDVNSLEFAGQESNGQQVNTYTVEELTVQLETDTALSASLAEQLGLESPDATAIVNALMNQFGEVQGDLSNQPLPETADGWLDRGLQQANIGDLDGAIASWDEALVLDANLEEAWQHRGGALGNLGRLEEAIASFEKVLLLNPENPQAWFSRGLVLEAMGNMEDAIGSYQKTLELDPSFQGVQERIDFLSAS